MTTAALLGFYEDYGHVFYSGVKGFGAQSAHWSFSRMTLLQLLWRGLEGQQEVGAPEGL